MMEIENITKEIRTRAFDRKDPKTPEQVGASWYNDDLTYDGIAKTLFITSILGVSVFCLYMLKSI